VTAARASNVSRQQVLASCGATSSTMEELLAYTASPFAATEPVMRALPLADEPHLEAWTRYEEEAQRIGAFEALKQRFVQLRFPIRAGISGEQGYRLAARKGVFKAAAPYSPGLVLDRPRELELAIWPTIAGRIPLLVSGSREDFVALVQAFTNRNEPEAVPSSMGACIVSGLNNWDRIADYRRAWTRRQVGPATEEAWLREFQRLVPRKELYQDRFVLLSRGPYSACRARDVGLDAAEWLARSLTIRREHEFTHYFTYRIFGVMRNNLLDELIADFAGLVRAFGHYRADLALRFLGLESLPRIRVGGRLQSYRGDPPLSDQATKVLGRLAVAAIRNLERVDAQYRHDLQDPHRLAKVVFGLASLTLEHMASRDMLEHFSRDTA